jgi:Probable Zinc-ribbon domain
MATARPDLAAELVGTDPTTVAAQTNKILLWRCPNHDEPYPATGADRVRGYGCGYCRGLQVLPGYNDIATTRPDLAAELVGTDPTTVIAGTTRILLWRCPNHDQPYPATGSNRTRGSGCGYCHGRRLLPGFNDMATTHPDLARDLVDTDPTKVIAGTPKVLMWRCPNHDQPYPASGNSRVSGHGCGYCHGLRVLPGFNDMAATRPDLAREVVDIDPTTVIAGTKLVLTWRCANHEETYRMTGRSRADGSGCPYCVNQRVLPGFNDMATTRPDMAACLVGADPTAVIAGTPKVLLWRCPNHSEPYPTTGAHRARGRTPGHGCGYCHGLQVLPGYNDMATSRPDMAAELVGTDPTTIIAGTKKILLWRCPNHDEPYPLAGAQRAAGIGCAYCANQNILPGFNDMATTHPSMAADLVDTDPTTVFAGTEKILLWRCPNHPEPYPARGMNRLKDRSCGYCSNRRVLPGFNDVATTHPDLALEVVDCDPSTVIATSPRKHHWRCRACGYQWSATGVNRARGTGCPKCADTGFDPAKPAWIYLMQRQGEQQIGITGNLKVRTAHHAGSGWVLVETAGPIRGSLAYEKELLIKQWLRRKVGTLAGTTENWSTASLEVRSLAELFDLAGIDE